jgi:hypothetical protein
VSDPYRIVAEVSKNWFRGDPPSAIFLSQKFEEVIEENRKRGYELESWQFCQTNFHPDIIVETIIAVFVRT